MKKEQRAMVRGSSMFVTRIKRNGAFKRAHNNARKKGGPVLSDVLIELTGITASVYE